MTEVTAEFKIVHFTIFTHKKNTLFFKVFYMYTTRSRETSKFEMKTCYYYAEKL